MLSAVLFFSLLWAASPRAQAEETGATVVATPDMVTVPGGQAETGVQGSGDLDVFRLNTIDHPLESAAALLRILPPKNSPELLAFRAEHCNKIAELFLSLHLAARESRISREEYMEISLDLAPYELRTMQGRDLAPGPGDGGGKPVSWHHRRNEVDSLLDMQVAANSGDKKKAEAAVNQAVNAYPQNHSVHAAAAAYYNGAQNYTEAEKAASAALALDGTDPDAYKARALARASLDDRKGAIEDIKKAMAADPQDESARVLAALLESRKAVTSLRSISSVDEIRRALGDSGEAGAVKAGAGAFGGLAGAGGEELAGAPDYARSKAYLKTALSKNRLGDYEGAIKYAGLAIEKDPANFEAYLERANAYNFLGRYDDAVRDAGYVIEKDPANLQAFNMRAWALNQKGKADAAAADASRAIGLNPGYADAWFNRALAYEKQGDYKRMLEDFRQAAALSGAYSRRYQDAVAQYGPRVPGFSPAGQFARAGAAQEEGGAPAGQPNPLKRFLSLMFFTLVGGALVAAGLVHIMTTRSPDAPQAGRSTHPDVLSPSVFYEGVATGKYKIERKLGEGAMGVVYEATDQSLGRKVAIKKMGDEIKVNEREKQRFLDEARTVALLHHPGIVEIYTIFEEDDNIYLVFEHVDGATMDKVLYKEARIMFDRARRLFSEAAAALAYAHSKNVVHRDLKLANIMLSSEDAVKVMDFGLAYRARESMARASNAEVVGSPAYMAPEQELGATSVQSDIYSLGVCLYEAISGVLPFQGPDFHHQKTHRRYQRLTDVVPGLPAELDAIVARCLEPDPEKRYLSAEALRRDLDALI